MRIRYASLALFVACVSSDRPAFRLELPADFAQSAQTLSVRRHLTTASSRGPFEFGDFRLSGFQYDGDVPSGRVSARTVRPIYGERVEVEKRIPVTEKSAHYEFTLRDASRSAWSAQCDQSIVDTSGTVMAAPVPGTVTNDVRCTIADPASAEQWTLSLLSIGVDGKETAKGELFDGATRYEIVGLDQFGPRQLPGPLGFRLAKQDATLGAVSLLDNSVKLPRELEPKQKALIATAMSALMLSRDLH